MAPSNFISDVLKEEDEIRFCQILLLNICTDLFLEKGEDVCEDMIFFPTNFQMGLQMHSQKVKSPKIFKWLGVTQWVRSHKKALS